MRTYYEILADLGYADALAKVAFELPIVKTARIISGARLAVQALSKAPAFAKAPRVASRLTGPSRTQIARIGSMGDVGNVFTSSGKVPGIPKSTPAPVTGVQKPLSVPKQAPAPVTGVQGAPGGQTPAVPPRQWSMAEAHGGTLDKNRIAESMNDWYKRRFGKDIPGPMGEKPTQPVTQVSRSPAKPAASPGTTGINLGGRDPSMPSLPGPSAAPTEIRAPGRQSTARGGAQTAAQAPTQPTASGVPPVPKAAPRVSKAVAETPVQAPQAQVSTPAAGQPRVSKAVAEPAQAPQAQASAPAARQPRVSKAVAAPPAGQTSAKGPGRRSTATSSPSASRPAAPRKGEFRDINNEIRVPEGVPDIPMRSSTEQFRDVGNEILPELINRPAGAPEGTPSRAESPDKTGLLEKGIGTLGLAGTMGLPLAAGYMMGSGGQPQYPQQVPYPSYAVR